MSVPIPCQRALLASVSRACSQRSATTSTSRQLLSTGSIQRHGFFPESVFYCGLSAARNDFYTSSGARTTLLKNIRTNDSFAMQKSFFSSAQAGGAAQQAAAVETSGPDLSGEEDVVSSLKVLPNGVKQLQKLLAKNPDRFLRLMVNSGGCSGYQYEFRMDTERKDDDVVFEQDGVVVVVDGLSLDFLGDCEVDYTAEMIRASFQVVKNSNAEAGCGCGASFSIGSGF